MVEKKILFIQHTYKLKRGRMLTITESRYTIHGRSLYYLFKFSTY